MKNHILKCKQYFLVLASIGLIAITAGCSTIEKRDETIPKKQLERISTKLDFSVNWQTSDGSGAGRDVANLVIGNNKNMLVTADYKGNIFARDKNTGKKLWQAKTTAPISAGPAVGKKFVVVVTNQPEVVAFSLKDGQLLWKTELSSEALAVPAISNKLVLVHTLDGKITALNSFDGSQFWQYNYSIPSIVLRKSSTPSFYGNSVVAGLANGKLISLLRNNGDPEWKVDLSEYNRGVSALSRMSDISTDPIIKNDIVYAVGYQGKLVAVSAQSGRIIWDKDASSYSGIAASKNRVYLANDKGHVQAFDAATGAKVWKNTTLEGRQLSQPTIYKHKLVIADEDGIVHFLSLKNGNSVGRYKFGAKGVNAKLVFKKNKMFILGNDGKLANITISKLENNNAASSRNRR